ncbi:hypothetical protein M885DRAFT_573839 [Pelagophyceae sp. CCMP2097]|nr:hypothetical protein M885DRAFT_573839 [Pelagophyceae sp. CCMP2097]
MQNEGQQQEMSLDGTDDDGALSLQLSAQGPAEMNRIDAGRLAVRNSPLPAKASTAARQNKPQIMLIYESRFTQRGAANGTGLVYCTDAKRWLFYLAGRYGTDRDWPPVQSINPFSMDSSLNAEKAGALIEKYDSPTSRKEGEGKNKNPFTQQTKQKEHNVAQKLRKEDSAAPKARGLHTVPMDERGRALDKKHEAMEILDIS